MSGQKDFAFAFEAARWLMMEARLRQIQRERQAGVDARLRDARGRAEQLIAAQLAERAAVTRAALDEARERARRDDERTPPAKAVPAPAAQDHQAAAAVAAQLKSELASLVAWQEALRGDEDVRQFARREAADWLREARSVQSDLASLSDAEALRRATAAAEDARKLHDEAGLRKGQFEVRNEFLRDVIDSLQAIGFFVDDPAYEDPNDAAGPVVVRAQRAGEEVVVRVDLSETVASEWNGIADARCKDSFLAFLDQMKGRGVTITPQRTDLVPQRIEQGKLELPASRTERAGN